MPHRLYKEEPFAEFMGMLKKDGIFMDVKSAFDPRKITESVQYWSL